MTNDLKTISIADLDQVIGKFVYGLYSAKENKTFSDTVVNVKVVYGTPYKRHVFLKNYGHIMIDTGSYDKKLQLRKEFFVKYQEIDDSLNFHFSY